MKLALLALCVGATLGAVDKTPVCCSAMTAACLACSTGVTQEVYCAANSDTTGCVTVLEKAKKSAAKAEQAKHAQATREAERAKSHTEKIAKTEAAVVYGNGPLEKAKKAEAKRVHAQWTATRLSQTRKVGDTSGLYCESITGRKTMPNGDLHVATALNPFAEDSPQTCAGTAGSDGVCCHRKCTSCDNSAANCEGLGNSMCCAKFVIESKRICSAYTSAPCVAKSGNDYSIRISALYAAGFAKATEVCFSAYGFYCQRVLGMVRHENGGTVAFQTPMNGWDTMIRVTEDAGRGDDDLARICFVPNPLPDFLQKHAGELYRTVNAYGNVSKSNATASFQDAHGSKVGPGSHGWMNRFAAPNHYRYANSQWPIYKKFLTAGCCKVCAADTKPCGMTCIAESAQCSKVPGVHKWCACDANTAERLAFAKAYPRSEGVPDSWRGYPHTYPADYLTATHGGHWKGFDTECSGDYSKVVGSSCKAAASFDDRGRMSPEKKLDYSPSATGACCRLACAKSFENKTSAAMQDCLQGCSMWIAKSSLNWESKTWWPKLKKRCTRDCYHIARWKSNARRSMNCTGESDCGLYYTSLRTPADENNCAYGCSLFEQCMDEGGNVADVHVHPPGVHHTNDMRVASEDSMMCPKGWGVLSEVDASDTQAPRVCCHYSCGTCATNCNQADKYSLAMYHDDHTGPD
eukprot:g6150.t1